MDLLEKLLKVLMRILSSAFNDGKKIAHTGGTDRGVYVAYNPYEGGRIVTGATKTIDDTIISTIASPKR